MEYTESKDSFLHNAEEDLDLVHPRGMKRSVVETEPITVTPIESSPSIVFAVVVDIEIIPNNMNSLSRIAASNQFHEFEKVRGLASSSYAGDDVARMHIQCGK